MWTALFPYRCILCLAPGDGQDLCAPCREDLPWLAGACPRCARPLPGDVDLPCGRCLRRPPLYAATVAAFRYEFPVDQLILKLKFGDGLVAGRVLGELLAQQLIQCGSGSVIREEVEMIVPVPLHPKRLRERGYNQALELARPVARRLGIPLCHRACRRVRHAEPQSTLRGKARLKNPADAFTADRSVAGKRVAVLDDVVTTGSTLAAVAVALHNAGAVDVRAWCVARA